VKDIVVVSDLHIGRGVNPETRRYAALETFFFDDDFRAFCAFLIARARERGRGFSLVINGDGFDFLRIADARPGTTTDAARRFAQELTPQTAPALIKAILDGHPGFVAALGDVVVSGNDVVIIPGNHDLEVHWRPVQGEIRAAVGASIGQKGDASAADALSRLQFRPWFYYEPGRVWIEHGCQYDPENAFKFPLRGRLADDPGYTPEHEADLPLGNFFQRYLYNAFGSITFIVPTSRANLRYAKWLMINEPRLLLRVLTSHFPFALQVLRRVAQASNRKRADEYRAEHEAHLRVLAEQTGLGDALLRIDGLKHNGADAYLAVDTLVRGASRLALRSGLVLLAFLAAWITAGQAIDSLQEIGIGWRALLSLFLNLVVVAVAVGFGVSQALRVPHDTTPRPLKAAAEQIARIARVPLVVFGHTHEEVLFPIGPVPADAPDQSPRRGWYVNSGTWIAVFTHDVLLPRERVQFSFVDIEGHDARLMHWQPERGAPVPVVLLDESKDARLPSES